MPCWTPLKAYRKPGGGVAFSSREGFVDRPLELPCGQCSGCRLERSRQWALRCVHEAQLHERNSFVTLTYSPEHMPADGGLDVTHWQLFAKRLRKRVGPFRFLHCGEYGDENLRPHYHACIFGLDFHRDRKLLQVKGANRYYSSALLEEIWGKGFCVIGHLTWQSAAYVARYVMKKATGELAETRYQRVNPETGETHQVRPEYVTMSRRPGLATEWFRRFKSDVYPSDQVVHEGKRFRPPKFYDSLLSEEELEALKRKRRDAVNRKEATPERLKVREEVQRRRLGQLTRSV